MSVGHPGREVGQRVESLIGAGYMSDVQIKRPDKLLVMSTKRFRVPLNAREGAVKRNALACARHQVTRRLEPAKYVDLAVSAADRLGSFSGLKPFAC